MTASLLEALRMTVGPAAAAAALVGSCTAVGFAVLPDALRPRSARLVVPLSLSVGATLIGLVVWLAGTLVSSPAALPLATALTLASLPRARKLTRELRRCLRELVLLAQANPAVTTLLLLLLCLAAPNLLLPLVDSDGLRYHVALPKLFLLTGKVFLYPFDVTGAFPQAAEMLNMVGLQMTRGEVAKLLHFSFFLATLAVLALVVHRGRSSRRAALIAPLLFAASPVAIAEAPSAFTDHLALFHVATAVLLARSATSPFLIGLVLGGAAVTKYTVLPAVVAVLGYAVLRQRRGKRWRTLGSTLLPIVVVTAPFAARNLVTTGDPVFPLGYGLLTGRVPGVTEASLSYARDFHKRTPGLAGITWDSRQGPSQPDEVAGTHHLLAVPAALVAIPYPPARVLLPPILGYAATGLVYRPPTRYLLPMLWCLAGLGALAADRWLRRWAPVGVALLILPGCVSVARLLLFEFAPLDYLSGTRSREEVIQRWVPGYRAARFVNGLPAGGAVMALDFPAPYYLDRPWIAEGTLNEPPLARWLGESTSADDVLLRLRRHDIRYLLVTPGYGGGSRRSLLPVARSPREEGLLIELRLRLAYLASLDGVDVYEVPAG